MFMQSIFRCLFIFGFTLLFGCGVKPSDTVTAVPGPQPPEAPAPFPSPGPQPSEKVFSIQLDPSEAPTQFKVNQQGEIRVAAAPEILTGRMVRAQPQFGRLPLTEERCARVDRMTLDVLSFRDSPEFGVSFRSAFQHLRTSERVEFKVQLPTLFRLDEDQLTAQQIKRQVFAFVD